MTGILSSLYDRTILERPVIVVGICLLIISVLAGRLDELKIDASADSLVLEGDEALDYFRESSRRYASEDFLVITVQPPGDLLGDESLATIRSLRDSLQGLVGVSSVTTILDVPLLQSPKVSLSDITGSEGLPTLEDPGVDRELVREEFRTSPIYHQLLVSPDGRTTAIQINLQRDERFNELLQAREDLRARSRAEGLSYTEEIELELAEARFKEYSAVASLRQSALVDAVRAIVVEHDDEAQLFLGGVPMIAADMVSFVQSDLTTFGAGIILFMIAVLAVIFRKPRWVMLPLFTCVATATFMLGLLATLDWRMTVISSNFVALLLIITLAITIHLIVRYRELHSENPEASQRELVLSTVQLMAKPCLYTALTTAVAFISLVVSGIRPVIDFGWMMTVGIASALVITFLLLPSLMMLMPKGIPENPDSRHSGLTVRFARATEKNGVLILVASLVLAVFAAWGISRLEVENRFIDYFHESTEIYQGMELLDAELGGTIPLDIILDIDEEENLEIVFADDPGAGVEVAAGEIGDGSEGEEEWEEEGDLWEDDEFGEEDAFAGDGEGFVQSYWFTRRGMNQVERIHDYIDSLPETGKVLSLATVYDVVKLLLGEDIGDVELALVQTSMPPGIASLVVDPYFSADADQARISLRVKETSKTLRRDQFLKDLRAHLVDEKGIKEENLNFTSMLVLYNNVLQSLYRSQILTIGAVFIAIMLMFLVLFRSFRLALIAITPNMLAAAIVLGGMGVSGIPLDIMTITIAAIVVGIGVDHAIHYVFRFQREFPTDRNYLATMYRCHESIGRAMYYTSITVIVGFSILALSNFTPSIYFGLLTGLAMLASIIGSLMLLPRLILLVKPLGPEGLSRD